MIPENLRKYRDATVMMIGHYTVVIQCLECIKNLKKRTLFFKKQNLYSVLSKP